MSKNAMSLVQPMFEGSVDVVGDVHGEHDALHDLMRVLNYSEAGEHPDGRRLVFVGDLVDRGPNSPSVIDLVRTMIENGRAQCVLGNHELNLLRDKRGPHANWFRKKPWKHEGVRVVQEILPKERREEVLAFLRTLPVALERSDLRVVHAAWDDGAIDRLRAAGDAMEEFQTSHQEIDARLEVDGFSDEIEHNLAHQNDNAIKLITSGPERRAAAPFIASGKLRHESRHPWWDEYAADPFCICGHYWRKRVAGKLSGDFLFAGSGEYDLLGKGRVMCIDYSVGARYTERLTGCNQFTGRLAAMRWPEMELVFDDGETVELTQSAAMQA